PGVHTLTIVPKFSDLMADYFLVAKVDSEDSIDEPNENNNIAFFNGGSFLVHEAGSGKSIVQVQGLDEANFPDNVWIGDGVVSIERQLPPIETDGIEPPPYYDLTGDRSVGAVDAQGATGAQTQTTHPYHSARNAFDVNRSER